jgi:predicted DNA binding protein
MKFVKLNISSDIFQKLGHPLIFEHIHHIEVLNILQYDPKNLFLLEKIIFRARFFENWRNIFKKQKLIKSYHLLKELPSENSILCLMRIKKRTALWPKINQGEWAILPPIVIDKKSLHINIILPESIIPILFRIFQKNSKKYEILAISNIDEKIANYSPFSPQFTSRQNEICRYAYRNGYFDSPKRIHSEDIAEKFNISTSAVTNHIRKASNLAFKYFFS